MLFISVHKEYHPWKHFNVSIIHLNQQFASCLESVCKMFWWVFLNVFQVCSEHRRNILIFALFSMAVEFSFNSSMLLTAGHFSGSWFCLRITCSLRRSPASSGVELPTKWQWVDDESLREGPPSKPSSSTSSQKTASLWQLALLLMLPASSWWICFSFLSKSVQRDLCLYPSSCTFAI